MIFLMKKIEQFLVLKKKNFTWAADFNVAYNKSEIITAGENGESFTYSSGWGTAAADYIIQKGKAFGDMYGFVADGFYNVSDFEGLAEATLGGLLKVL